MPRSKSKKRECLGPAKPPQSIESQLIDQRRRGFLTGAVTAGAGVGATALLVPETSEAATGPIRDGKSPTYRETDHIREAYRRMRF